VYTDVYAYLRVLIDVLVDYVMSVSELSRASFRRLVDVPRVCIANDVAETSEESVPPLICALYELLGLIWE
jgi:hypothetical protein